MRSGIAEPRALQRVRRRERWLSVLATLVMLGCAIPAFASGGEHRDAAMTLFYALAGTVGALAGPVRRRVAWLASRRGSAANRTASGLSDAYRKAVADARSTRNMACLFFLLVVLRTLLNDGTGPLYVAVLLLAPLLSAWAAAQAIVELRRLRVGLPGRPRRPKLERVFS